jgi:hypothetical protein
MPNVRKVEQCSKTFYASFRFALMNHSHELCLMFEKSNNVLKHSMPLSDSSAPPSRKSSTNENHGEHQERAMPNLGQTLSHKSQDSGFSDSADSNAENSKNINRKKQQQQHEVHSEVVHETRTSSLDRRQYHVSKVYFYSISDIISQEAASSGTTYRSRDETGTTIHFYCWYNLCNILDIKYRISSIW